MTLFEGFVREQIYVDPSVEPVDDYLPPSSAYPWDAIIVGIRLRATEGLIRIADRLRKDQGFVPMLPMDEYADDTCDSEVAYTFCVGLNSSEATKVNHSIEITVTDSLSGDDGKVYQIVLLREEQEMLYRRLDEQCKDLWGQSCEEILEASAAILPF